MICRSESREIGIFYKTSLKIVRTRSKMRTQMTNKQNSLFKAYSRNMFIQLRPYFAAPSEDHYDHIAILAQLEKAERLRC